MGRLSAGRERRQPQREDRSVPGVPNRAAAAVGLSDRVDDRQPEPDAAGRARPGRVGAGETLEDPRQRVLGHAAALVLDLDHQLLRPVAERAELDRVVRARVLDRVLDERVERRAQPVRVDRDRPAHERSEPPCPRSDLRPSHEHVLEERLDVDLLDMEEVGLLGGGEQEQPVDDRVEPGQLVKRDVELGIGAVPEQQLEVAARDRHRRAQLVRSVVHEPLLELEHRAALLGSCPGDIELMITAPSVPDRDQHEHDQDRAAAQNRRPVGHGHDPGVGGQGERRPQQLYAVAPK